MCSIVIRDRLSVIVWRRATLSCRCLEREVSPVASSGPTYFDLKFFPRVTHGERISHLSHV